ncbi:MAG: glucosaminidase domain-containing protein [Gammaproteobacteria bacterium]
MCTLNNLGAGIVSVAEQHGDVGINYGTLATCVALLVFLAMLVFLSNRWVVKFPPLPDFTAYRQVKDMKAAFSDYLTPIIEYHNEQVLKDRKRLAKMHGAVEAGKALARSESRWLHALARKYDVYWNPQQPVTVIKELISRVDIVPVQLAVVQAAKESSWGRSRYAVQSNNIFGQWCYKKGCGVIPRERPAGARHEVRQFDSISDAIGSYIHNLNSHYRYKKLRKLRQDLRNQGLAIEGNELVDGLLFYSERRQQYVEEIRSMIRQYRFFQGQRTKASKVVAGI